MAYLLLAYPDIKKSDFELIQNFRKENDKLFYSVVDPHFTIVFPVFDFSENLFVKEIIEKAKDIHRIKFVIRCATINKDVFSEYFHTFLVPDEGYSKVIKLHDLLYSGKLKDNLRLDIDFVPHIGIGNSKDGFHCQQMAGEWNEKEFAIDGTISRLTIVNYESDAVTKLQEIELQ